MTQEEAKEVKAWHDALCNCIAKAKNHIRDHNLGLALDELTRATVKQLKIQVNGK